MSSYIKFAAIGGDGNAQGIKTRGIGRTRWSTAWS